MTSSPTIEIDDPLGIIGTLTPGGPTSEVAGNSDQKALQAFMGELEELMWRWGVSFDDGFRSECLLPPTFARGKAWVYADLLCSIQSPDE